MRAAAIAGRYAFELQNRLAHGLSVRGGWQWSAEGNGYMIRNQLRPLPKEATPFETEDAAPELVQMNG
mgnify:CR=1 FL=1